MPLITIPSYSGELRIPIDDIKPMPFGPRKVIVRRAAMELFPGAICNLGAGVSTGISTVAAEEGLFLYGGLFTNEQGLIGGAPITGRDSGGAQNFSAMIEQPAQFDFYDGGGLDLAFLSFAEVDAQGNVNVSRFGDKIIGIGGFINISQNARCVVFGGALMPAISTFAGRTARRSSERKAAIRSSFPGSSKSVTAPAWVASAGRWRCSSRNALYSGLVRAGWN